MIDRDLKQHVESALEWEPSVHAKDIAVAADGGVVTLRGTVPSYSDKVTAERVALRVFGVKAVANDLNVHLPSDFLRTDTEVAQAAIDALRWSTLVPLEHVTVTTRDGWITLAGTVDWQYQKSAAVRLVRDLRGVRGVTNDIVVRPAISSSDVRAKIEDAFKRSAQIDARRLNVTTNGDKVILSGTVHSLAEREEASRAAWAAPGVSYVDDRLSIAP